MQQFRKVTKPAILSICYIITYLETIAFNFKLASHHIQLNQQSDISLFPWLRDIIVPYLKTPFPIFVTASFGFFKILENPFIISFMLS